MRNAMKVKTMFRYWDVFGCNKKNWKQFSFQSGFTGLYVIQMNETCCDFYFPHTASIFKTKCHRHYHYHINYVVAISSYVVPLHVHKNHRESGVIWTYQEFNAARFTNWNIKLRITRLVRFRGGKFIKRVIRWKLQNDGKFMRCRLKIV